VTRLRLSQRDTLGGLLIRGVHVGDEVEEDAGLGDDVDDAREAYFLRQAKGSSALGAQQPQHNVADPADDCEPRQCLHYLFPLLILYLGEHGQELRDHDDEEDQRPNPPEVLVRACNEGAACQTRHHDHIRTQQGDERGEIRLGKRRECAKHQGGGDETVNISGPEDDTWRHISSLVLYSNTSPHSIVGKRANHAAHPGEGADDALLLLGLLQEEKDTRRDDVALRVQIVTRTT
jgi:hypothetical protein